MFYLHFVMLAGIIAVHILDKISVACYETVDISCVPSEIDECGLIETQHPGLSLGVDHEHASCLTN